MGSPPGLEGLILFFKSLAQTKNSSHILAEQFSVVLYHQVLQMHNTILKTFLNSAENFSGISKNTPK